ncbi:MAG: hypothetical protein PUK36_04125, partial [Prevotella sp.]|nr:hypothetical protein [Prevotella sp.]
AFGDSSGIGRLLLALSSRQLLFTLHFSLFTKNHVVWLSCCLVVLLIERNLNRVSAIFHSSLFTFHFSLKIMLSGCLVV